MLLLYTETLSFALYLFVELCCILNFICDLYKFLLLISSRIYTDIAIDQVVALCCSEGEQWGLEHKQCASYDKKLEIVPQQYVGMCLSTVEICCAKQQRIFQCAAGQVAAKEGKSCQHKNLTAGRDEYKVKLFFYA